MRAINHAATGAIIGLTIVSPLVALPVAFASHFILDAIPHHGVRPAEPWFRSTLFKVWLYVDAVMCGLLLLALILYRPHAWPMSCMCAVLAVAPDLAGYNFYKHAKAHKQWKGGYFMEFSRAIQWFERPIGIVVEVAWLIAAVAILIALIHTS